MASSWTPEYAGEVKSAFYDFLKNTWVKSKEKEWIILGEHLYGAQVTSIERIFEGLGRDIHDFKILKSRQLGISTIIRALGLFWLGMFSITGCLMFDTTAHLDEARRELIDMLERFPVKFRFPRKAGDNRYGLTLENRSRMNLVAAGTRESKGSKSLGSSSAVSFAHRSELCSYGNVVGLEGWRHSLARTNPNRLFIDESTAKGYNIWKEIWDEAKKDHHCITIFSGWWSHPDQRIDQSDPDFEIYGTAPLSDVEKTKIKQVYAQYGHEITAEQLAWIRREMNPTEDEEGDAEADYSGDPLRTENQPWTEEDAFQMTGSVFFAPEQLTAQMNKHVSQKFRTYRFEAGIEFVDFRAYPAPNARSVELKVWEEPVEESVYIVSADVAFGRSEFNDRSSVEVLRAYSDGLDQVAEYCWPLINARQLAWVIAALEGWYAGERSEIYRIVDINGPGEATWMELQILRHQLRHGYFGSALKERGFEDIQRNVRNYIYTRSDSMGTGHAWQFKAQQQIKVAIMERLRDFMSNGMIRIRSKSAIEEMRSVTRDGDDIAAQGATHDDNVYSLAMGCRCWEDRVRRGLILSKRSRKNEAARRSLTMADQVALYNNAQFDSFLAGKGVVRRKMLAAARRQNWRSG